jgi:hypothetical protein
MNDLVQNEKSLLDETIGLKLLDSHRFWAKKRLLFNLIVGVAGLIPTLYFILQFYFLDIFGILAWGLVANGLYSIGYVLESIVITKSDGNKSLKKRRNLLFWIGTISYALVSVSFGYSYFNMTMLPFLD